jgi:hypothetical protein
MVMPDNRVREVVERALMDLAVSVVAPDQGRDGRDLDLDALKTAMQGDVCTLYEMLELAAERLRRVDGLFR